MLTENGPDISYRRHSHHGWDDNYNTQTITAGHNGFGGSFRDARERV